MASNVPLWRHLLHSFMRHKVLRKSFFSPAGLLKKCEALPIVVITSSVFVTASLYFSLYYPWSRTDVQYRLWTPLFERMDLASPKQCKFRKTCDYRNYEPLTELDGLLTDMKCAELKRADEIKDWHEEKKQEEGTGDPCVKRGAPDQQPPSKN